MPIHYQRRYGRPPLLPHTRPPVSLPSCLPSHLPEYLPPCISGCQPGYQLVLQPVYQPIPNYRPEMQRHHERRETYERTSNFGRSCPSGSYSCTCGAPTSSSGVSSRTWTSSNSRPCGVGDPHLCSSGSSCHCTDSGPVEISGVTIPDLEESATSVVATWEPRISTTISTRTRPCRNY